MRATSGQWDDVVNSRRSRVRYSFGLVAHLVAQMASVAVQLEHLFSVDFGNKGIALNGAALFFVHLPCAALFGFPAFRRTCPVVI